LEDFVRWQLKNGLSLNFDAFDIHYLLRQPVLLENVTLCYTSEGNREIEESHLEEAKQQWNAENGGDPDTHSVVTTADEASSYLHVLTEPAAGSIMPVMTIITPSHHTRSGVSRLLCQRRPQAGCAAV
jgi:hypothetical protein